MEFKSWLLSEESFLGWNDLVHQLNIFVNQKVRQSNNGVHVALEPNANHEFADINIYMKLQPGDTHSPEKLIQGVQYFLQDKGIQFNQIDQDASGITLRLKSPEFFDQGTSGRKAMRTGMRNGTSIDVNQIGIEIEPGMFRLTQFIPNADYVDAKSKKFIYWIGKDKASGEIFASVGRGYYGDSDYETLWMR